MIRSTFSSRCPEDVEALAHFLVEVGNRLLSGEVDESVVMVGREPEPDGEVRSWESPNSIQPPLPGRLVVGIEFVMGRSVKNVRVSRGQVSFND